MNMNEAVGLTISHKKPSDCQIRLINPANQEHLCSTNLCTLDLANLSTL